MTDHIWTQENLAAYVMGGLDTDENARLESHVAACADCARLLDDVRATDLQLETLFANRRPGPALEDHMIGKLRQAIARPKHERLFWYVKLSAAVAAVLLLGFVGASVSAMLDDDGKGTGVAQNFLRPLSLSTVLDFSGSMNDESDLWSDTDGEKPPETRARSRGLILGQVNHGTSSITDVKDANSLALEWQEQTLKASLGQKTAGSPVVQGGEAEGFDAAKNVTDGTSNTWDVSPNYGVQLSDGSVAALGKKGATSGGGAWLRSGAAADGPATHFFSDGAMPSGATGMGAGAGTPASSTFNAPVAGPPTRGFSPPVLGFGLQPGVSSKTESGKAALDDKEGVALNRTYSYQNGETNWFKPGETFKQALDKHKIEVGETLGKESKMRYQAGFGAESATAGVGAQTPALAQLKNEKKVEEKKSEERKFDDKAKNSKGSEPSLEAPPQRKFIIRTGEIEFEVDSFDVAVATTSRLVLASQGGYIATINSEKLPNGKVRGSVVLRIPPEQLDALVLDLRKEIGKAGELKGQRIGSQDITKQYTDIESRLKAARTMEERLLRIIRDGKGEIKDLLQAEKELGVWRTRIEEMEGELRYYGSQVSLSTLTVTLAEKEIRTAAAVTESERVQAGIEVEDVEKAMREAQQAIAEAKGRVTRSEMKQQAAGQFNAVLHFQVKPEQAGPLRDRLRQLGNMVRLEVDRVQQAEGGNKLPQDGKLERGDTQFMISLYNLTNVAPRETVNLRLAASDVPEAYQTLRKAILKGRVLNAQLSEQDRQNVTARLDFDIKRTEEDAVQKALTQAGDVISRQVSRVSEGENVTDAKVLFKVEIVQATNLEPRESWKVALEVSDVETSVSALTGRVKEAQGAVVSKNEAVDRSGRVTVNIIYRVPLNSAAALVEKTKGLGHVRLVKTFENPQAAEGKLALARLDVTLSNVDPLVARDDGLWAQVRQGLSVSLRGLSISASFLIVGVLFVLPWAILIYAVVWLGRRLFRRSTPPVQTNSATTAG